MDAAEYGDGFFLIHGISLDDISSIRKNIIYLSKGTGTGMDYFEGLSLFELYDLIVDYLEVVKDGRK